MLMIFLLVKLFALVLSASNDPNCTSGRTVIVQLFNWKWTDIAAECERFLGPKGFCGVQVSPPNEHRIVTGRPWWERYQPVSYQFVSRSGNATQFQDMVSRCNAVNVKIYIDAVINHMIGDDAGSGTGIAGSSYNTATLSFGGVPYSSYDFNTCGCGDCCSGSCNIENYGDIYQVRNCRLVQLLDLALSKSYVRNKIADFLTAALNMGVAGFRVDACKHMWPGDLQAIFSLTGGSPFIVQEVIDMGGEPITASEYTNMGRVTEFKYGTHLGEAFRKYYSLNNLQSFGQSWGMLADDKALVFVDNHDNQRGGGVIITYKESGLYKKAVTFMLAWPYGFARLMSSYDFSNTDQGPPSSDGTNIDDVTINQDGTCGGGWICEHRWRQITNMVGFRNVAEGQTVANWWDNGAHQIAFSRGNKAFYAVSNEGNINTWLATGMPQGTYCDIISGDKDSNACTGKSVYVSTSNKAQIIISGAEEDPIIAFHESSKLTTTSPSGTARTVIFIKIVTSVGQDVFLRGGFGHDVRTGCTTDATTSNCALAITYNNVGSSSHYDGYNTWRTGDTKLDWYGAESSQYYYNSQAPEGSPCVWTSDQASSPGYVALNQWGEHYWMIDVNIDCGATEEGWFEFKAFVTNGAGWESDISQGSCTGTSGGTAPYSSTNHMAKCGKVNVFEWNSNSCIINTL